MKSQFQNRKLTDTNERGKKETEKDKIWFAFVDKFIRPNKHLLLWQSMWDSFNSCWVLII